MPATEALLLLAAVGVVGVVCQRFSVNAFAAGLLAAVAFALASGLSISLVGKAFSLGFSGSVANAGLVILMAALVSSLIGSLAPRVAPWLWRKPATALAGLLAGLGSTPTAGFAGLMPLLHLAPARLRPRYGVGLALGLSASHATVLPSPVVIAAMAILAAPWQRVLWLGLPVVLVMAVVGSLATAAVPLAAATSAQEPIAPPAPPLAGIRKVAAAMAVGLAVSALLIAQSLGAIPSEPLGGGPAREMLIGLGRPLSLLLVGVAVGWLMTRPVSLKQPPLPRAWVTQALLVAAPLIMVTALGGAMQKLTQETGMAEMLGEGLLDWRVGVVLPFAVALVIKALQGSSLVAAITAAGMIAPLLVSLGLDSDTGRALAALAIGAGSLSLAHINDDFYWLVSAASGLKPRHSLGVFTLATLAQGLAGLVVVLIMARVLV